LASVFTATEPLTVSTTILAPASLTAQATIKAMDNNVKEVFFMMHLPGGETDYKYIRAATPWQLFFTVIGLLLKRRSQ
jgi:hypothetical protein